MPSVLNTKDENIVLSDKFITIADQSFDDLMRCSKPITEGELEYMRELTDGVEIDLDVPLDPCDD